MNSHISVLLVDDSLVIRAALKNLLSHDSAIEVVASSSNGQLGIEAAKAHKPDVVILDIEMPIMDGLTALPQILEHSPHSQVIMFSSLTEKGASHSIKAMELGAVECLLKPSSQESVDVGSEFEVNLTRLVKALGRSAHSAQKSKTASAARPQKDITLNVDPMTCKGPPAVIAIGSSTGGPDALFKVCAHLKGLNMPIIITQHMPATFTKILARHIEEKTGIPSHEGETDMILEKGHAYVAPGGFHMVFKKTEDGQVKIILDDSAPVNYCKPAVDPMFKSILDIYGSRVLGVILTGMGNDGIGGGAEIVKNKARLVAQDEKSCVVWGMPRAVAEAGYCNAILPLDEIGPWVKSQTR